MGTVRQQITIDASPRQVWGALTTEDGIRGWWGGVGRVDAREGGRIVLAFEVEEGTQEARGLFHKVQPTREIEIAWDAGSQGPERGTRLSILLGRQGTDTKVHVVATGAPLDDEAVKEAVDTGWKEALARLRKVFEG